MSFLITTGKSNYCFLWLISIVEWLSRQTEILRVSMRPDCFISTCVGDAKWENRVTFSSWTTCHRKKCLSVFICVCFIKQTLWIWSLCSYLKILSSSSQFLNISIKLLSVYSPLSFYIFIDVHFLCPHRYSELCHPQYLALCLEYFFLKSEY